MRKKVTIQDIADALGVSRNTVSKAINNTTGLAPATRDMILQKAVEMGYKQFSYVNAVAGGGTGLAAGAAGPVRFQGEIALLTSVFLTSSHFASLMLDKFQREISQLGYTLNTHRVNPEELRSLTLPATLQRDRTSAIICIEMFNRAYDGMLCELGLPVLFVDTPARLDGAVLPADQLYMDNTTGITRLVHDLLGRGIRRIGFIGDYAHCQSFFERYTAFRCAMLLAGAPVEDRWCIRQSRPEGIAPALAALEELPEMFVCANDFVAVDAIHALRAQGKRIPEDVLISGFDDAPEARMIIPNLTTVHIHTQIMAFSAVQLLMARIKEPSLDFRTVYTETELIYRESTGH